METVMRIWRPACQCSAHTQLVTILAFLRERGWTLGRYDASREPLKVEIQTLLHGNAKDQDQI